MKDHNLRDFPENLKEKGRRESREKTRVRGVAT